MRDQVQRCDYCADLLSARNRFERVLHGRSRVYCCQGCAFIAEQLALLPDPQPSQRAQAAQTASQPPQAPHCAQLEVRGMVCAACALLLEHQLRKAPGVCSASVDFISQRAYVIYDRQCTDEGGLARCIQAAGYRLQSGADPLGERRSQRKELLRVLLAWLAMMQVMMLAVPGYLARPGEIAPDIEQMLRIGQLILSAPVALFCAAPFWRAAASQLRVGHVGMDVPVALGLGAALVASVVATAWGQGAVYFDSVTMFVALLLGVRWWQLRILARTNAQMDAASRLGRLRAHRLRGRALRAAYDTLPAEQLQAGDFVLVAMGETVPADGHVVEGSTNVSQSWLTGESAALEKSVGDTVLAGSLNLGQAVVLEVSRAGDATSLAALQRMIVEAASQRPAGVELVNRVAAGFALAVLGVAMITALLWLDWDAAHATSAAIAVLVVTCPCALSLAAPLAFAVAQARLAAAGVLLTRPAALESLARTNVVAFDKTGTLTEELPRLLAVRAGPDHEEQRCLQIAAALEARSRHPFALALQTAARERKAAPLAAVRVAELLGAGVEGIVGGRRYRLGKPDYALAIVRESREAGNEPRERLRELSRRTPRESGSQLLLASADGPLALFHFAETLRPGAARLLQFLGQSHRTLLLVSGDAWSAAGRIAQQLEADSGQRLACHAEQSPGDKRRLLAQHQAAGRRVAMIGDGINDAPVIAQADASIALASGAQLTQVRADIIILESRLESVVTVFAVARRATRTVRQNLLWALAYNGVMVPLAALGLLAPWQAALGMAASAAFVLGNSLRLRSASLR